MGEFDAGLFFWTVITFLTLMAMLARFAFRPMNRMLSERENRIRSAIEQADKARLEAEKMLAANDDRLKEAREEVGRVIAEGHRLAESMRHEAAEHARAETNVAVQDARREIDREVRRSLDELKSTVANLAVRVSRQVIRESLDEDRHLALAEEFVDRLKESHGRKDR
jgi:F-type H+-transporting ATPase subunit b